MDVPVRDWFGSFLIAVNIGFAEIAVGHRIGCDIQGFWSDFQLISPVLLPCCRNSRAVRLTGASAGNLSLRARRERLFSHAISATAGRSLRGKAFKKAAAARNILSSLLGIPTICRPIDRKSTRL